MTTALTLAAIVATIALLYFGWALIERRHSERGKAVAKDLEALGDDAVPPSLHPVIDPDRCIGSGACVAACPEGDVLSLISGRGELVNPLACVGHGACMAACPVGAISLVFGTAKRGVELPMVDKNFQTNLGGVYIAGELGGMGLIRNAVEQGRQAAEAIVRSGRRGKDLDGIIVGAGPAGIAAALAFKAQGLRPLILEQSEFGGTVRHYPRAKVVMTGSIGLPGYGTIRRRTMSKEELMELWEDVRKRGGFPVEEGRQVDRIEPAGDGWKVGAGAWEAETANVVLALGRRGSPRTLGAPGEKQTKVHYRLLEPEPFERKHVLVVGGGNAAADVVLALSDFGGCNSVALSYRRKQLARLRGSVRQRLEGAFSSGTVAPLLGTEVQQIETEHVKLKAEEGLLERANDAVIVQIGGAAPAELLKSMGVQMVLKRGEA